MVACLLVVPALMINLGSMPYTSDEPTRAIVTLEMIWSGNYITPTFTGEYYYNKPPLFNWLMIPFLAPNGGTSELWLRIPAILALMGFLFTIYHYIRKWFGHLNGILAALMYLTCGRILFWDSMLGLIDILYSWVTFTTFMVTIDHVLRRKFISVFLITYLLASIGFMLKGMPALVFQAITLLTVTIAMGEFRRLFSWQHVAGVGLFILLAGSYLWAYAQENSPEQYLAVLWDQSSQRTAVRKGWFDSIKHLVLFHPKMIYHFLPWSAAIILLLKRSVRQTIVHLLKGKTAHESPISLSSEQQKIIRLIVLIFLTNVAVYWLSPATIPRYVLMLAPLTFIPVAVLITSERWKQVIIPWMIIALLVLRIAFNLFWIPEKSQRVAEARQKEDAFRMANEIGNAPLRIAGKSWIDHSTLIYLMAERQQPIHREHQAFNTETYYLADEKRYAGLKTLQHLQVVVIDSTFIRHQHETAYLIKLEPINSIQ
jgi:4-amino-4-deoxy-L-arabinose transferase-like glycosyltransferase